eukprot:9830336-Ditylum_brightwellii.AAC.1
MKEVSPEEKEDQESMSFFGVKDYGKHKANKNNAIEDENSPSFKDTFTQEMDELANSKPDQLLVRIGKVMEELRDDIIILENVELHQKKIDSTSTKMQKALQQKQQLKKSISFACQKLDIR